MTNQPTESPEAIVERLLPAYRDNIVIDPAYYRPAVAAALRARDERIEELEALIRELLETHRVSCQTKIAGLEAKLAALTTLPPSAEPSPPASDSSTTQRTAADPQE